MVSKLIEMLDGDLLEFGEWVSSWSMRQWHRHGRFNLWKLYFLIPIKVSWWGLLLPFWLVKRKLATSLNNHIAKF
jgi:hypothetical protein